MADSITATSTIPLTTVFIPPAGCRNSWTYEAEYYNSINNGILLQNMWLSNAPLNCFPPGFNSQGRVPKGVLNVYSPGACPSGYTTFQQLEIGGTGSTAAVCCYDGFTYYTVSSIQSGSLFASSSFVGCLSTYSGSTTLPGRNGYEDLNTTSISGTFTMWAQPLIVEHQPSDLSLWTSGSTTSGGTLAPTGTLSTEGATITATNSPSTENEDNKSDGLSTGAKAGIAVGAVLGLLLLLALTVIPIWRKKRRQHRQQALLDASQSPAWRKKNLSHNQGFLLQGGPSELNGQKDPVELDANDEPRKSELMGAAVSEIYSR